MAGVDVVIPHAMIRDAERMLRNVPRGIEKALPGAVNDTAKMQVTDIGRKIRERVAVKKKDIDPHIKRTRASATKPSAVITLSESKRLSLKRFGARQTKRGVSYKIEKKGTRQRIASGFGPDIARLGQHVYARKGRARLPIVRLHGPSPWGVFVKSGVEPQVMQDTQALLERKLNDRVRFVLLKHGGKA